MAFFTIFPFFYGKQCSGSVGDSIFNSLLALLYRSGKINSLLLKLKLPTFLWKLHYDLFIFDCSYVS